MALYHFSVRHVSRGKGQMVVASAAYISGQRIFDSYYNKIHDYTSKSGVVFTEILTPEYVPERLTDRETLWNEVEHVERNNKAQLAYSFDIALQNELTLEENIRLAKEFCQEQFVERGMIVDLAVHKGKSDNEEEPDNPHFHVLVPIRPFTEEGIWGNKQRREYILDEDGNRVKDAKGKGDIQRCFHYRLECPGTFKGVAEGMDRESKWEISRVPHGSQNRPPFLQRTGD